MEFKCPKCSTSLQMSGDSVPKFCSDCGTPFSDELRTSIGLIPSDVTKSDATKGDSSQDKPKADLTLPAMGADVTLAPNANLGSTVGDPGGRTQFHDDEMTVARNPVGKDTSTSVPGSVPIQAGRIVGPYRLVSQLGQGGMGTVYEAVHNQTGQRVALKLLSRSVRQTEESVQRFKRESQIAASINHPRSTFVYEAGEHEGQLYITMELMDGGTLKQVVDQDGKLPVGRAVDYILDMIDGLQVAHEAGIVHRDIKPSNCFVDSDGRVKIGDFGLAKSFIADSSLTQTGTFMGTPQYAAPEQLRASEVGEHADLYALGATLFFLLTGRPVFQGGAAQVISSIASDAPPKIETIEPEIPRELSRIIAWTLEKDPARRPENLRALSAALSPFATQGSTLADVGRRMTAFFVDLAISGIVATLVSGFFVMALVGFIDSMFDQQEGSRLISLFTVATQVVLGVAYFAISEWRWGRTLGKWLMGMRVVGQGSASPNLVQSLIRALMIPGITWMANALPIFFSPVDPNDPNITLDQLLFFILLSQSFTILGMLPNVLFLMSARAKNGYQCLHGIISKTKVVRLSGALEMVRMTNIPVTLPTKLNEPTNDEFGAYRPTGLLNSNGDSNVYVGKDKSLDRRVWISVNPPFELSTERKALNRSCRLRVLSESTDFPTRDQNGERWQITEAVEGAPLVDLLATRECKWESVRPVLQDLATELRLAVSDGSLPKQLSVEQVWIDRSGRLKLLDQPIGASQFTGTIQPASESPAEAPIADDGERAKKLLNDVIRIYTENNPAPLHVVEFGQELQSETGRDLAWARTQLTDFADRPSSWKWDDRLGTMAVGFGLELPVLMTFILAAGSALLYLLRDNPTMLVCSLTGVSMAVAFASGALFRGGPALRFSGVRLCRNKTHINASKFRCGVRSVVTWLPFIALFVLLFVGIQFNFLGKESVPRQGSSENLAVALIAVLSLPVFVLMMLGCTHSILRPRRAIPDWIAGTTLIRE